jgi:hypothetical protein
MVSRLIKELKMAAQLTRCYLPLITEMAERHNVAQLLKTARSLTLQLQTLIENK